MLKTKGVDTETNKIIDEATRHLMDAYASDELDLIEDWEVNELLSWTNGLNFEESVSFRIFNKTYVNQNEILRYKVIQNHGKHWAQQHIQTNLFVSVS
jgi:hypothetical protein